MKLTELPQEILLKIVYIVGLPNEPKKIIHSLIALIRCGRQLLDAYHAAQTCANNRLHGRMWISEPFTCYPSLGSGIKCAYEKKSVILDELNKTEIFRFISSHKNMIIGGGFPTQLWLDQIPRESSDIDVYVTDEATAYEFLDLIKNCISYVDIYDDNHNLIQFWWSEVNRVIQVIFIQEIEVLQIIQSYDLSYCKCYIYGGRLFAMPDAVHSFRTKKCVGYWKYMKFSRVQKSQRYCDSVMNIRFMKYSKEPEIQYKSIKIEKIKFTSFRTEYMCAGHSRNVPDGETRAEYLAYFNPFIEPIPIPSYLIRCIPYVYIISIPVNYISSGDCYVYTTPYFDFDVLQKHCSFYQFYFENGLLIMRRNTTFVMSFEKKNDKIIIRVSEARMPSMAVIEGNTMCIALNGIYPYIRVYQL